MRLSKKGKKKTEEKINLKIEKKVTLRKWLREKNLENEKAGSNETIADGMLLE